MDEKNHTRTRVHPNPQRLENHRHQELRPQSPAPKPEETLMYYIRTRASKHFNREEMNLLLMLAEQKNQNLMCAYELYCNDHDEVDFLDIIQRIMKKEFERLRSHEGYRGDHPLHITPQKSDTVDIQVDGVESGGIQESEERIFERRDSLGENFVVHSVETLDDYNSMQGTAREIEATKATGSSSHAPVTPVFDRSTMNNGIIITTIPAESEKATPQLPSLSNNQHPFHNFSNPQPEPQVSTIQPSQPQPAFPVSQPSSNFNKALFSSFSVSKEDKPRFLDGSRNAEQSSSLAVPTLQVNEKSNQGSGGSNSVSENPFMLSEQRGSPSTDSPPLAALNSPDQGDQSGQASLGFAKINQGSQPSTPDMTPAGWGSSHNQPKAATQTAKLDMIRYNQAFVSFRGDDMRKLLGRADPKQAKDKNSIEEHKEEAESSPCKVTHKSSSNIEHGGQGNHQDEAAANLEFGEHQGFTFPMQHTNSTPVVQEVIPQYTPEELAYYSQMLKFVLVHDGTDKHFAKLCADFVAGGQVQQDSFLPDLDTFAKNKFCKRLVANITPMNLEEILEKPELFSHLLDDYKREQTSIRMLADKLMDVYEQNKGLMNKGAKLKEVGGHSDTRVQARLCMTSSRRPRRTSSRPN